MLEAKEEAIDVESKVSSYRSGRRPAAFNGLDYQNHLTLDRIDPIGRLTLHLRFATIYIL